MIRSIFFDDWQACLRAHYIHVIRTNDAVTEPTLRHVLLQSGVTEADLEALVEEARQLGPLDADTVFDPGAGGVEISEAPPEDALPDMDEIGDELPTGEFADEAFSEDDAEGDPDLVEDGYDEREIDEEPVEPDEPPSQQLSLF